MRAETLKGQGAQPIEVGAIVENFSAICRVEKLDEQGALLVIVPAERDGVQQGGVGQRYYADPAKCRVLRAEVIGYSISFEKLMEAAA